MRGLQYRLDMDVLSWLSVAVLALAVVAVPALLGIRAQMTAALEKERRARDEALAALEREKHEADARIRVARESGRREALDEFVRQLRVEQRSHVREANSMFSARRILVCEERLCFGDQPLSTWIEQQVTVEEGMGDVPRPESVFLAGRARLSPEKGVNPEVTVTSSWV